MYQNPTQAIMLQGWSTFHWPKNEHEYIILFSGLPYFQVHRPNSVNYLQEMDAHYTSEDLSIFALKMH
jgi:hypothetical protein